jgi:hypothetical protein
MPGAFPLGTSRYFVQPYLDNRVGEDTEPGAVARQSAPSGALINSRLSYAESLTGNSRW